MQRKENYLIWRHEEGTFTALHKLGRLSMWSTVSGQVLGKPEELAHAETRD